MIREERGFTLIEVLVISVVMALVLTLGVASLQRYGRRQSLEAGTDQIVTELRGLQQRVVSESNPLVYGARFIDGAGTWDLIKYDPDAVGSKCSIVGSSDPQGGLFSYEIEVVNPSFVDAEPVPTCTTELGSGEYVFFYARGTATAGTLEIRQPDVDDSETVTVNGLTARVTRS